MRQCIRCGAEMTENLIIRQTGDGMGLTITTAGFFPKKIGKTKAAVCPECGEISVYLEDTDRLKNYIRNN